MKRSPLLRSKPLESKTSVRILKQRKCANCREPFRPFTSLVKWCSPSCGAELGMKKLKEKQDREHKVKLADSKPLSHWLALTERVVNAYVLVRDKEMPCISCGTRESVLFQAGHYLSKGAHPELRFVAANIHKQCHRCNVYLSGNQAKYRMGLVARIGDEGVQALEVPYSTAKYSRESLAAIRKLFAELKRELEKQHG